MKEASFSHDLRTIGTALNTVQINDHHIKKVTSHITYRVIIIGKTSQLHPVSLLEGHNTQLAYSVICHQQYFSILLS